jgi:Ni/Fe-hydrogenase 1 B-type cytochrome subunit
MNEEMHHPIGPRILHWSWVVIMILLGLTGLYIHNPHWCPIFANLALAWAMHLICGLLLVIVVGTRVFYSVYVIRDFDELVFKLKHLGPLRFKIKYYFWAIFNPVRNRKELERAKEAEKDTVWPVLEYYTFLSHDEPDQGKYNTMQRMMYFAAWLPMLAVQFISGIALYFVPGLAWLRILHFVFAWFFAITVILHIYLGAIHGWKLIKSMITGKLEKA